MLYFPTFTNSYHRFTNLSISNGEMTGTWTEPHFQFHVVIEQNSMKTVGNDRKHWTSEGAISGEYEGVL